MKHLPFVWLVLFGFCFAAAAAEPGIPVAQFKSWINAASMRFDNYSTRNTFGGARKPPVLDTWEKRQMKTVLREAAKKNPNFDGKYVIASWGCGTNCQQFALIDLETGKVTFGVTTEWGLAFRRNSSLLVVNDPDLYLPEYEQWNDGIVPSWVYTRYYRWDGKTLVLLKSINR